MSCRCRYKIADAGLKYLSSAREAGIAVRYNIAKPDKQIGVQSVFVDMHWNILAASIDRTKVRYVFGYGRVMLSYFKTPHHVRPDFLRYFFVS